MNTAADTRTAARNRVSAQAPAGPTGPARSARPPGLSAMSHFIVAPRRQPGPRPGRPLQRELCDVALFRPLAEQRTPPGAGAAHF
jgi:hypothetical protein